MANTNLNLVGLDFNDIKSNLKAFLKRSESPFKDIDYEGSNVNQLLDVFAYNTYLNSFYLNMVASEMFLDSATLRDSVISHAKELNYVPRSYRSSEARISFTVTPTSAIDVLLMPKGTSFTTKIGSNNFTFVTDSSTVLIANSTGYFNANNIFVYEGNYLIDTFVYDSANTSQRYVISNPTVDTRSITVVVLENGGANSYNYTRATSFLDLQANSQVYFLQAAENSQYELIFGDDVVGRKPQNGSAITVEYRVCNGELPNGASSFNIDGPIQGQSNVSTIITNSLSRGGGVAESLQSIKRNAPRYYQNQDRAVTSTDYENLLLANFPEIDSVSAFGGDQADPPQYGRVFIAVDVNSGDGASLADQDRYKKFLLTRSPIGIEPVFISPEFLYVEIDATVRYNTNVTNINNDTLDTLIRGVISSYNNAFLNGFKKTLRYSKLIELINNINSSIVGVELTVLPFYKITPLLNKDNDFVINLGFELSKYYNLSTGSEDYIKTLVPAVYSSRFTFDGDTCTLQDNGSGEIYIYRTGSNEQDITAIRKIGTVDYTVGSITINSFNISDYVGNGIHIHVNPVSKDIASNRNTILTINDSDVEVFVVAIKE